MFQQSILRTDFILLSILIGLSLNAFGQKNKKQIDSINALNKKIIEYDLRFLENPLIHIPKKSKTKIDNNN